jgi:monoterpene epsilon-lactone hydrolase
MLIPPIRIVGRLVIAVFFSIAVALVYSGTSTASESVTGADDGAVHIPAYALPESSFLSQEMRVQLNDPHDLLKDEGIAFKNCPSMDNANRRDVPAIRKCQADAFYKTLFYQRFNDRYRVTVTPGEIGGVYSEVFTPVAGISKKNKMRVLINVHGGSFDHGSRYISHLESMPIAALGQIKVISIDYRMAPEYTFPAASEDVTAVYQELLKTYSAKNIGIYGCSAGGLLTAEAVAWLQKKNVPLPGAVGMLCEGAGYWTDGDSGYLVTGVPLGTSRENPYFKGTDANDALAFPIRSSQVMARFPPSLLISGTRDIALSSVVYTHSVLVAQGVQADLHVWEGLGHGFFLIDPDLPQSHEVYSIIVKFFDKHLGV